MDQPSGSKTSNSQLMAKPSRKRPRESGDENDTAEPPLKLLFRRVGIENGQEWWVSNDGATEQLERHEPQCSVQPVPVQLSSRVDPTNPLQLHPDQQSVQQLPMQQDPHSHSNASTSVEHHPVCPAPSNVLADQPPFDSQFANLLPPASPSHRVLRTRANPVPKQQKKRKSLLVKKPSASGTGKSYSILGVYGVRIPEVTSKSRQYKIVWNPKDTRLQKDFFEEWQKLCQLGRYFWDDEWCNGNDMNCMSIQNSFSLRQRNKLSLYNSSFYNSDEIYEIVGVKMEEKTKNKVKVKENENEHIEVRFKDKLHMVYCFSSLRLEITCYKYMPYGDSFKDHQNKKLGFKQKNLSQTFIIQQLAKIWNAHLTECSKPYKEIHLSSDILRHVIQACREAKFELKCSSCNKKLKEFFTIYEQQIRPDEIEENQLELEAANEAQVAIQEPVLAAIQAPALLLAQEDSSASNSVLIKTEDEVKSTVTVTISHVNLDTLPLHLFALKAEPSEADSSSTVINETEMLPSDSDAQHVQESSGQIMANDTEEDKQPGLPFSTDDIENVRPVTEGIKNEMATGTENDTDSSDHLKDDAKLVQPSLDHSTDSGIPTSEEEGRSLSDNGDQHVLDSGEVIASTHDDATEAMPGLPLSNAAEVENQPVIEDNFAIDTDSSAAGQEDHDEDDMSSSGEIKESTTVLSEIHLVSSSLSDICAHQDSVHILEPENPTKSGDAMVDALTFNDSTDKEIPELMHEMALSDNAEMTQSQINNSIEDESAIDSAMDTGESDRADSDEASSLEECCSSMDISTQQESTSLLEPEQVIEPMFDALTLTSNYAESDQVMLSEMSPVGSEDGNSVAGESIDEESAEYETTDSPDKLDTVPPSPSFSSPPSSPNSNLPIETNTLSIETEDYSLLNFIHSPETCLSIERLQELDKFIDQQCFLTKDLSKDASKNLLLQVQYKQVKAKFITRRPPEEQSEFWRENIILAFQFYYLSTRCTTCNAAVELMSLQKRRLHPSKLPDICKLVLKMMKNNEDDIGAD